jgi:hypothetical protein
MAYDFSVEWQCLSKRTVGLFITDQTPHPYPTRSLPAQFATIFFFTGELTQNLKQNFSLF